MVLWAHTNLHTKRNLDPGSAVFTQVTILPNAQTDIHTDLATCVNCVHAMRPKTIDYPLLSSIRLSPNAITNYDTDYEVTLRIVNVKALLNHKSIA